MTSTKNPLYRTIAAALAAVAALAAGAALTACSASPGPAVISPAAAAHAAPAPRSCKQQYSEWKQGTARAEGKKLTAALQAVQSASAAEDLPAMTAALKTAGTEAAALGSYPMPACADPHGYWNAVLARIRAAGDNAGTASGLGALLLAGAPLKEVPGLEAKLTAELKQTTA